MPINLSNKSFKTHFRQFSFLVMICVIAGCVALPAPKVGIHQLAFGSDRLAQIANQMIEEMSLFFSKQIVWTSQGDCPLYIMIDPQKIDNESAQRLDMDVFVKHFRQSLLDEDKNADKSLLGMTIAFINPERQIIAISKEGTRKLNRPACAPENSASQKAADYMLMGRIISDDKIDEADIRQRRSLLSFWLLDLETGAKAWASQPYIFQSYGQNDVIYR